MTKIMCRVARIGLAVVQSLVMVLLTATTCAAQDVSRIDHVIQSYTSSGKFMGSVLIARGDEVVFGKGYGAANLDWNIPNSPSTKFRIASLTKQFTAASILWLEERGKLRVNDPVKMYLPNAPATWDQITIVNLP